LQTDCSEVSDDDGVTICYCFDIPDTAIRKAVRIHRLREVDEVTELCEAGGGCSSCHHTIEELIDEVWQEMDYPNDSHGAL
jgi:NifU-like protein